MIRLTPDEFTQGYVICGCKKYAYVFSSEVVSMLPKECTTLCNECEQSMVPVELIREALNNGDNK